MTKPLRWPEENGELLSDQKQFSRLKWKVCERKK